MPGQKINEVDRKKIDAKFICMVCSLLLSMPMQTQCGHLLCYECLQKLLNSPSSKCPSDGIEIKNENVFLDEFTRRELMGLHLHCPNEDCDWSGTNKDLQEHLAVCDHALIECVHNQCKKEVKRAQLAQHLQGECLHRQVSCKYCNGTLAFNLLEEHLAVCDHALIECVHNQCKKEVKRAQLAQHLQGECLHRQVSCKYCNGTLAFNLLEQHEASECDESPIVCPFRDIGCNHPQVLKRKESYSHAFDALVKHLWLLLQFVLNIVGKGKQVEKRVENLEKSTETGNDSIVAAEVNILAKLAEISDDNRRLKIGLSERDLLMVQMRERLDHIDASMAKVDPNEGQVMTSYNGTYLWKMHDFSQKRRDAVSGTQTAIYSPPFYSSHFGYKMCARIYLNGDGFGKKTHISLFFVVMKGEHDALLPWPFQKKITMMMLDQNTGDHMVDAFRSDPESSSFQRPKNNMNVASGSPLFMPLDGLNNRVYVKDDTIFIKIIVD